MTDGTEHGSGESDRTRTADPEGRPTVTVVVPVYDDVDRLRLCLRALARQDYPAHLLDVVVVDNASPSDQSPALPTGDARFRLLHEARRGSYAARNTGVAAARGDVLAFTDADCVPRPDWISRAVDRWGGAADRAVGGDIRLVFRDGRGPVSGPELYEVQHDFLQRTYVERWHFAATANLVVPRPLFERVGAFDSALQSGGDLDWGRRLAGAGGHLVFAADAVVEHPSRPTWGELGRKTVRVANGLADKDAGATGRPALIRQALRNVRGGTTIWVKVWFRDRPEGVVPRLRYATAFTFVRLLRSGVHLQRAAHRRPPDPRQR
nr:glycosyltransferase [uncultured Actinotalea sp.]